MIKTVVASALLLSTFAAHAVCPSTPTASRFVVTGAEATDLKTGLVWARCSVGQSWSGSSCTGTATTHTHEQALQLAQAANGWRLPNVKELASIIDNGCFTAFLSLDLTVFASASNYPSTYWSSSPYTGGSSDAWSVSFASATVDFTNRQIPNAVRLVRASP